MENMPINIVDIITLVVLLLSGILATMRGFVREVLSIGAWVGAAVVAIYGYHPLRPHVDQLTDIALLGDIITAAGLFLVSLVAFSVLSAQISKGVKESSVGSLDRALGFLFGLARGAFLVCLIYLGASLVFEEKDMPDIARSAKSYPYVKMASEKLLSLAPENFKSGSQDAGNEIRQSIDDAAALKRLNERLNNPKPAAPTNGQKDGQKDQPGYSDEERSQLDSLIQDNQ